MKYIFSVLFVFATTIAHGQSTEIGLRGGFTYNSNKIEPSLSTWYFAPVIEAFVHPPSKKRISYELSIGYYSSLYAAINNYNTATFKAHKEISIWDRNFNSNLIGLYRLSRPVRRLCSSIGHSAGLQITRRQENVFLIITDTASHLSKSSYRQKPINPTFGIIYIISYAISKRTFIDCKAALNTIAYFNISNNDYPEGERPNNFLSLKFGFGYKI